MSLPIVLQVLAILILILCGFMLVPTGIAAYLGESRELLSFILSIVGAAVVAGTILFVLRRKNKQVLSTRGSFLLVTLSWICASFLGCLPFYLSGAIPCLADAFFETMSGFTTTGASILTHIEGMPRSLLFWRSLTHWLGGMGIVVLTVAVLPLLGIGGLQLLRAEAPGPTTDKVTPRITETAKILWLIYLGLTVVETALLMAGGMDLFDGLTHTFGTLATGGFSPKNKSVGHYDSAYIDGVVTVFMLLAGMNFILHFKLITGRFREAWKDTEFKAYIGIFLLASFGITLFLWGSFSGSFARCFRFAAFQAASILTTTGYATTDFELWVFPAQILLFFLMFIGGCSGSTGGGIKVIRIVTLLKEGLIEMKHLIHPRGVFTMKIGGKSVHYRVVHTISGFFFLYILMLLATVVVVSTAGVDITTSMATALVTVGNIGPGFGKIGPTDNYAFYPDYVKWFLSFAMMVGRLELYTVLVLLTPAFWRD
jgi:trk system potassium uptake protein TrkH